jgi:hypothetical protein
MPGHGEKMTRRWEQAIISLLTHATIGQAAKAAKLNEATLRRWMREPKFKEAFHNARADVLQQALGHAAEGLVEAALVLRQILRNQDAPASARVAAARTLFDLALKDREVENLEQQMQALRNDVEMIRAQFTK